MKITVNEYYQKSDPESREVGEFSDSGVVREEEMYTLEELQDHLESFGFQNPSDSTISARTYIESTTAENKDFFEKGIEETHTLHLVKMEKNGKELSSDLSEKVWRKLLLEASNQLTSSNSDELSF